MKRTLLMLASLIGAGGSLFEPSSLSAQEVNPVRTRPARNAADAQRILVKFRATGSVDRVRAQAVEDKVATLAARAGVGVRAQRPLGAALHVLDLDSAQSAEEQLARVRADAAVEYAALDRRRYAHALPNDPLYSQQWYLQTNGAGTPSAIDAEHAWDLTTGSSGVVVAVLDTGVRFDHPDLVRADLGGRLLPGYDFVGDTAAANDGDGRDADASDPGDFVSQADVGTRQFANCDVSGSSWHGTRVAGLIGARTNNAEGIAGGTWSPWILPVRVLGKCGGFDSDILAAMLWAGGVHVNGVPDNPYPAKVENLSLGALGACSFAYADVIAELATHGVLVVVSAGNEGGPVDSPANCAGAVGVAGLRHAGTKVGFSSLGPEIAIAAPAGNCVNVNAGEPCLFSIGTTVNLGSTVPSTHGYTDQFNRNVGTSFSAPIVAGIAGLMAAANGNLGAAQLRARLQEGASTPFPVSSDPTVFACHIPVGPGDVQASECSCTTDTCGAGMANAQGAVRAALRPIAAVAAPVFVSAGQRVQLSGVGSAAACGRTLVSYAWSVVAGTGVIIGNPATAAIAVDAPTSNAFTVRLTVTDDAGRQDSAIVVVSTATVTTDAPANAGSTACLAAIPAPALPVLVSVAPVNITVQAGGTQSFAATVTNTQNTAVNWHVDGVPGGNATIGTISAAGVYAAPATVAVNTMVTVTAAWSGDSSRAGNAQVTVTPAPAAPPANSGGGGGGGSGLVELLALLASLTFATRRRSGARVARN